MFQHSIVFSSLLITGFVASASDNLDELMSMSLEQLSMLDVSMETASKSSQKLTEIPASVYVLSNERIIRSGVRTIAEALSLVPGLYVSKWNENTYHVSARGFHDGLYNKMLVMVDGRSVYSPIYGGVYWSTLDYVLADIDRIEVLRGPSGAIWGGNAANGVVNIITKPSSETLGSYISGTVGRYSAYDLSIRQGVRFSESTSGRAFYKTKSNPIFLSSSSDNWQWHNAGIQIDNAEQNSAWQLRAGGSKMTSQLELNDITFEPSDPYNQPVKLAPVSGEVASTSVYAQFNYQYEESQSQKLEASLWFDHVEDESPDAPGEYTTVDLEAHYTKNYTPQHEVIFGGGARYIGLTFHDRWQDVDLYQLPSYSRTYDISSANDYIANAFIQSTYAWTTKLSSVVGIKGEYFEQNSTFELSPQARLLYSFNDAHQVWGGLGRAVMSPSYMDSNSYYQETRLEWFNGVPYGATNLTLPNDDLDNETVWTAELGYRFNSSDKFELDATVFYSDYENIRGNDCFNDVVYPGLEHVWFCFNSDDYSAKTKGIELASHYQVNEQLSVYATYSYLSVDANWQGGTYSNGDDEHFLSLPSQHLASLQTLWNINENVQWDFVIHYLDNEYTDEMLAAYEYPVGASLDDVKAHFTFDSRLAWRKNSNAPLFELIAQKIQSGKSYDSWALYPNEQLVYVRVSHEF
ncbi:TonB-dependent outer membrane receptor [Vibrio sinaloensis DSM 21326]|uniref:TonB-dependent outer membrane receptor n=1 Tax=Vibrio sinaloensis DSM 21326 TaxID=945550 RepID=E8MAJ9_PHOS4|nr:TonB-dependent receptor [Vibrio sinaloensis]EGA68974.1 TonB-dependent outer membrane receptor [Vibrio sinaloensis DSM 21326]